MKKKSQIPTHGYFGRNYINVEITSQSVSKKKINSDLNRLHCMILSLVLVQTQQELTTWKTANSVLN
jgi:hypothetical protein